MFGLHTLLLWLSGPLIFIIGVFISLRNFRDNARKEKNTENINALSDDEERRLKEILKDETNNAR